MLYSLARGLPRNLVLGAVPQAGYGAGLSKPKIHPPAWDADGGNAVAVCRILPDTKPAEVHGSAFRR